MSKHARTKLEPQRTRVEDERPKTVEEFGLSHLKEEASSHSELDIETECPRCHEIMELRSDFDALAYFCESCSFLLKCV
jgi:phage FluMu protein Com